MILNLRTSGRIVAWLGGCLAAIILTVGAPARAADEVWAIDPEHTRVRVTWDHLGVSRQSLRVEKLYGSLTFSPTEPSAGKVDVTLLAASITSGVPALDRALHSGDFFDVERHPHITFRSVSVRAKTDKTGEVLGELTVRGTTRPAVLDVIWNFTGEHPLASFNPVYAAKWVSGFSARTVLKRSDFGMTLAAPLVSDEVVIEIEMEFLRNMSKAADQP